MASVTSLDSDMKKLRLSRYTPQAANEARTWIESTLGEKLPPGDLLEALKDGTALCKLANLALPPPGIKFKKSPMPFIQMENISHFLRACESPPLNLPSHDRFLTVDLYESKDPAQVLQCLSAFSRVAHSVSPRHFPTSIGPKKTGAVMSPQATGGANTSNGGFGRSRGISTSQGGTLSPLPRDRALSPTLTGGSGSSKATDGGPRSPQGPVSSWSKRSDEGFTAPAWNIHQYGYMGGANQGSQGIVYGGRRQITTAAPHIPNSAEKERKRREQEAEAERLRIAAEEAENKRRIEREAEEERLRLEEERRWREETERQRDEEKKRVEAQKQEWEEQERMWKADEERRRMEEEEEALQRMDKEKQRKRAGSDARLRGQYLSEYQAEQTPPKPRSRRNSTEDRVRELERQLEEAKARELQYERERQDRRADDERRAQRRARSRSRPRQPQPPARDPSPKESEVSWAGDERDYLRQQWTDHQQMRAVPANIPARPLPNPQTAAIAAPLPPKSPRPLPDPNTYKPPPPPSQQQQMQSHKPPQPEPSSYKLSAQPQQSQQWSSRPAKPLFPQKSGGKGAASGGTRGGWNSKSLLEREMERERERQREWEQAQKATNEAVPDRNAGSAPGQSWNVHQYGYMGGDNQSRGGSGIGFGAARRQIIGPRPPP